MNGLFVSITRRSFALIACETLVIMTGISLGAWISLGSGAWNLLLDGGLLKAFLITGVCQVCLYYADSYELRNAIDRRELFLGILQALSATSFRLVVIY